MTNHGSGRELGLETRVSRTARRDDVFKIVTFGMGKHKVPHPYSGAEENAPSLTGIRDDEP